jgi:hypothetical protein
VESTVKLCDKCKKPADCQFKVWQPGESTAVEIDLCFTHGNPLIRLLELGTETELPAKPRQRMELTTLKTTKQTAQYKKKKRTPPKR